jgi:hypothetical protein
MFQKDYWRMPDEQLTKLAEAYRIPPTSVYDDIPGADEYFDRDRVIASLVARDSALWAGRSIIISILALIVSLLAVVIPLLIK